MRDIESRDTIMRIWPTCGGPTSVGPSEKRRTGDLGAGSTVPVRLLNILTMSAAGAEAVVPAFDVAVQGAVLLDHLREVTQARTAEARL